MINGSLLIRDQSTKAAALVVFANTKWQLFSGKTAGAIDYGAPVLCGQGPGTFALPSRAPGASAHALFAFTSSGQNTLLAERLLPMHGGYNFRDLGGFPAANNKYVAWGKLFRSDDLQALTPEDLDYLASIPLSRVVDFRTEREIARLPDRLPPTVNRYLPLPILPGSIRPEHALASPQEGEQVMVETYRLFVRDPEITMKFKEFFRQVQDKESGPLLFHCAAGKDRTGFAAALVLFALGVHERLVVNDYLASAQYLTGKFPSSEGIFGVQAKFLRAAVEQIETTHGSVEGYLTRALDVDIEHMRGLYLE